MSDTKARLGAILVEMGLISKSQLQNALSFQQMLQARDQIERQLDVDDAGVIMLLCKVEALIEKLSEHGLVDIDDIQHQAQERFIVWEEAFPNIRSGKDQDDESG